MGVWGRGGWARWGQRAWEGWGLCINYGNQMLQLASWTIELIYSGLKKNSIFVSPDKQVRALYSMNAATTTEPKHAINCLHQFSVQRSGKLTSGNLRPRRRYFRAAQKTNRATVRQTPLSPAQTTRITIFVDGRTELIRRRGTRDIRSPHLTSAMSMTDHDIHPSPHWLVLIRDKS